ncbi:formylglycine-generating enzyme family protein [Aromatoleum toluclasticum]|nr:formylglycine-generating enzyme family protein [Aromatoleum toluclasticum]
MKMDGMVFIDDAVFKRGSSSYKNEMPISEIRLSPYWIDIYPVTNQRFARFIEIGGYQRQEYWTDEGWAFIKNMPVKLPLYWHDPLWNQPAQPVTGVSWWEAMAFAKFECKTLPTEAQWEYAAGLGIDLYPWGDSPPTPELANYARGCEPADVRRRSTRVDQHPRAVSRAGCHDMAGNLHEWCIDNSTPNYAWDFYCVDPVRLENEELPHIVRGGSGLHDEDCLRCTSRDYYSPEIRDNIVGIRCVINESRP